MQIKLKLSIKKGVSKHVLYLMNISKKILNHGKINLEMQSHKFRFGYFSYIKRLFSMTGFHEVIKKTIKSNI